MPVSTSFLFKNVSEYNLAITKNAIPKLVRGIYVLYNEVERNKVYEVVYVGMARGEKSGAKSRLNSHFRKKVGTWTHFSVYEVWDNISESLIKELEGLLRHVYRFDPRANRLNKQKGFKVLNGLRRTTKGQWVTSTSATPTPVKRVRVKAVANKTVRRKTETATASSPT